MREPRWISFLMGMVLGAGATLFSCVYIYVNTIQKDYHQTRKNYTDLLKERQYYYDAWDICERASANARCSW